MRIPFIHTGPPIRCGSLRDITGRAGGRFEEVVAAHTQRHRLPDGPEPLRAFFASQAQIQFGSAGIATIPGGRVFGHGVVLSPCGTAVARDVSIVFGGRDDDHWITRTEKLRRATRIRGAVLVVASEGAANYYHWLLDELPRLLLTVSVRVDHLLATDPTPFSAAAASCVGRNEPRLALTGYSHYQCEQLIVPTYLGYSGQPSAACVRLLNEFGDRVLNGRASHPTPERVYLSRRRAAHRKLVNEDELMTALDRRGFQRVELETLPWVEQVALFRGARVVVAPHGAGLANLVFARPGCRVVECFHPRYMHWCFWQIASLNDLDYHAVVMHGSDQLQHRMEDCVLDIVAHVPEICRVLDRE